MVAGPANGSVPQALTLHGYLTVAVEGQPVPLTGEHRLTFRLYDMQGAAASFWDESLTVAVQDGYYSVELGATVAIDPMDLMTASDLRLGIAIDGAAELTPRLRVTAVPYALTAYRAQAAGVADELSCGACVSPEEVSFNFAASESRGGPATNLECPGGCVGANDLEPGAVGSPHIQVQAITASKLAGCPSTSQVLKWNGLIWVCTEEGLTGTVVDYVGSSAPPGWVLLSGKTIGGAASGATERAHADTEPLFVLLWNSMADGQAPVSGGRGLSATDDFHANKTITLPDGRGRTIIGQDSMGGTTANRVTVAGSGIAGATLGAGGGNEAHVLTETQVPNHGHSAGCSTAAAHQHSDYYTILGTTPTYYVTEVFDGPGNGYVYTSVGQTTVTGLGGGHTHTVTISATTGGGAGHPSTQPSLVLNKIIKL